MIGIAVAVGGVAVGVAFGVDGRRSALKTQSKLDAVLRLIREGNPGADADLAETSASLNEEAKRLQRKALAQAIAQLPERERIVLTLRNYQELTESEIARVLGTSPEDVFELHNQARRHLSEALEGTNG